MVIYILVHIEGFESIKTVRRSKFTWNHSLSSNTNEMSSTNNGIEMDQIMSMTVSLNNPHPSIGARGIPNCRKPLDNCAWEDGGIIGELDKGRDLSDIHAMKPGWLGVMFDIDAILTCWSIEPATS